MASIRKLKDEINRLTFELINECFTFKNLHPEKNGQVDEVIRKIVQLRNELISRTNHPEINDDSKRIKTHYRKIRNDLEKLSGLVEDLNRKA